MDTCILKVDWSDVGQQALEKAAKIIKDGGLVAFPTETVYGLGGDAKNFRSAKRIYRAKGRPSDNPLIVHIATISQLDEVAEDIPEYAEDLAEAFWPGPLTLILNKNRSVPRHTTGGLSTVAVRMPDNEIARELIIKSECLIAAPSANASGRPSPTTAEHVKADLNGRIDAIIDAGPCEVGVESTILDLTTDVPTILRPGMITKEMIEQVLGRVIIDASKSEEESDDKPKAPGMKYKHYAPKASLTIVEGRPVRVASYINSQIREGNLLGLTTGIIASEENRKRYGGDFVKTIGSLEDEKEIAHNLYSTLREFDDLKVDRIYSESFDNLENADAIMNRLEKAAGHKVISADKVSISRIIFAGKNGSNRSPMAASILKTMKMDKNYEILSRGILVQFPEPLNPKIEAVLKSNGIEVEDYHAEQLKSEDITPTTIVFTLEESHRDRIIETIDRANEDNTFVLTKYVGNELEIPNPYGGSLQLYGLCFESIKETLNSLVNVLDQEG